MQESSRQAAKSEKMRELVPKQTRHIEDEATFLKRELEKVHERIDSLQTRVQDLEAQIERVLVAIQCSCLCTCFTCKFNSVISFS